MQTVIFCDKIKETFFLSYNETDYSHLCFISYSAVLLPSDLSDKWSIHKRTIGILQHER